MSQLCRHILPAGHRCTQPAVNSTLYCRHHQVIKLTLAKVAPTPDPYGIHTPLPFVFSEDRAALQLNYSIVIAALNDKRIDLKTANAFNRLFRSCEINLRKGPLHEPHCDKKSEPRATRRNPNEKWLVDDEDSDPQQDHGGMVQVVILTPEREEIAPACEVFQEGTESHGEVCPCQRCAEQFRNAPPEPHHHECQCGHCQKETEQSPSITDNGGHSEQREESAVPQLTTTMGAPSLTPAPAVARVGIEEPVLPASDVTLSIPGPEEEERIIRECQAKAREIFSQLGYPFEAPRTNPNDEQAEVTQTR
jgi:hypothetical protein